MVDLDSVRDDLACVVHRPWNPPTYRCGSANATRRPLPRTAGMGPAPCQSASTPGQAAAVYLATAVTPVPSPAGRPRRPVRRQPPDPDRALRGPGSETAPARRRLRPAPLPGTCPTAATAVDEQAADRIRDGIQAARTTGRLRNASHCSSVPKSTSNTTPHLSACHAPSRTPLVSAASIRAESCCSCHRKAETSPCRTSIDHHSATSAIVRRRPRTATPVERPGSRRGHSGRATLATAFRSRKATGTAARINAPVRANAAG